MTNFNDLEIIKKLKSVNLTTKVLFFDKVVIAYSGTVKEVFNNKDNERLNDFLSKTK